ncbi:MAG TPA: type II toxin-antitoxin system VapC family toxin [Solirubrobacteraceae bacterium]|nr:type II toxin-antitoxin system VapC family toxin [Solirubrobacteraceae bacterium]
MTVVLDANVLIVLALDRQRAGAVEELLRVWKAEGEELHAPVLLRYEIASALAQAVSAGQLASNAVADASQHIGSVPIILHQLNDTPAVVAMAQRLERRSAYDAAYVVLAEELGTQLWTLDGRLARNAASRGLPVQLIQTD